MVSCHESERKSKSVTKMQEPFGWLQATRRVSATTARVIFLLLTNQPLGWPVWQPVHGLQESAE